MQPNRTTLTGTITYRLELPAAQRPTYICLTCGLTLENPEEHDFALCRLAHADAWRALVGEESGW